MLVEGVEYLGRKQGMKKVMLTCLKSQSPRLRPWSQKAAPP